jgi:hypothetical protein
MAGLKVPTITPVNTSVSAPGARLDVRPPAEAFGGGAVSQSQGQTTQAITKLGQSISERQQTLQGEEDELAFKSAFLEGQGKMDNILYQRGSGFYDTRKGKSTVGMTRDTAEALQTTHDDVIANVPSHMREAFTLAWDKYSLQQTSSARKYESGEVKKANVAADNAIITSAINQGTRTWQNQEAWRDSYHQGLAGVENLNRTLGWDIAVKEQQVSEYTSKFMSATMRELLLSGDLSGAKGLMAKHGSKIDAATRKAFTTMLQKQQTEIREQRDLELANQSVLKAKAFAQTKSEVDAIDKSLSEVSAVSNDEFNQPASVTIISQGWDKILPPEADEVNISDFVFEPEDVQLLTDSIDRAEAQLLSSPDFSVKVNGEVLNKEKILSNLNNQRLLIRHIEEQMMRPTERQKRSLGVSVPGERDAPSIEVEVDRPADHLVKEARKLIDALNKEIDNYAVGLAKHKEEVLAQSAKDIDKQVLTLDDKPAVRRVVQTNNIGLHRDGVMKRMNAQFKDIEDDEKQKVESNYLTNLEMVQRFDKGQTNYATAVRELERTSLPENLDKLMTVLDNKYDKTQIDAIRSIRNRERIKLAIDVQGLTTQAEVNEEIGNNRWYMTATDMNACYTYAARGGNPGKLTSSMVNSAIGTFLGRTKGGKGRRYGLEDYPRVYDEVQKLINPNDVVNDALVRKLTAQVLAEGEAVDAGLFGRDPNMRYIDALEKGLGLQFLPFLQNREEAIERAKSQGKDFDEEQARRALKKQFRAPFVPLPRQGE